MGLVVSHPTEGQILIPDYNSTTKKKEKERKKMTIVDDPLLVKLETLVFKDYLLLHADLT